MVRIFSFDWPPEPFVRVDETVFVVETEFLGESFGCTDPRKKDEVHYSGRTAHRRN